MPGFIDLAKSSRVSVARQDLERLVDPIQLLAVLRLAYHPLLVFFQAHLREVVEESNVGLHLLLGLIEKQLGVREEDLILRDQLLVFRNLRLRREGGLVLNVNEGLILRVSVPLGSVSLLKLLR